MTFMNIIISSEFPKYCTIFIWCSVGQRSVLARVLFAFSSWPYTECVGEQYKITYNEMCV